MNMLTHVLSWKSPLHPSSSTLLLIISKRSPSSCRDQWACVCVNCQYKTALAWAQMKTHSWQGIGEYRLLRCWQMFFLCSGQITVCVKKIWLSLVDSCKRQVTVNIKRHSQPIFLCETGYSKINSSNTFYSLFTSVFLFHALLHSHFIWWGHLYFMRPYLWMHTTVSHKHLTTVILLQIT